MAIAGYIAAHKKRKLGKEQQAKADLINPERPEYEIPGAMKSQVGLYRGLASQATLPGQAQMEDKLNASTATGIGAASRAGGSAADVMAAASGMVANQTRSLNDMTIEASRQRRSAQGLYGQSLGMMAEYQDQAFDINKMQPYMNDVERKQALSQAGVQNEIGAYQDAEEQHQQNASNITGVMSMGGSDRRIKKNIEQIGTSESGLGVYKFEYKGYMNIPGTFTGAMADEVKKVNSKAVGVMENGFMGVYYDLIDVNFEKIVN